MLKLFCPQIKLKILSLYNFFDNNFWYDKIILSYDFWKNDFLGNNVQNYAFL